MKSFDACEPCLMGKMTNTPLSGKMEQATDLLEIIHIDVKRMKKLHVDGLLESLDYEII